MTARKHPIKIHPIMRELLELRVTSGKSRNTFAKIIGYSQQTVMYNEIGARSPTLAFITDYAQGLGLELKLTDRNENS